MPSPSGCEFIIAVTTDYVVIQIKCTEGPDADLTITSQQPLPLPDTPRFIQPVDPMAWGNKRDWAEHDVLLSVSNEGELAFWAPETEAEKNGQAWRCTGTVRTEKRGFKKAKCSSMKKTALGMSLLVHTPTAAHLLLFSGWPRRLRRADDMGFHRVRVRKGSRILERR